MKRILCAFLLLLLAALSLSACGKTPKIEISADGYWVIDGEKTDVKAQGDKGEAGEKGDKGDPGEKGETGDAASDENPLGLAFFLKDDGTYAVEIGYAKYLSNVEIPATYKGKPVTEIGGYAFYDCDSLTSVTIGNSVAEIGGYAFEGCESLTSITVDPDNTVYQSIDGNLYSKDGKTLIQYAIGKTDTHFSILDAVTEIGEHAFSSCTSLTSVTIPDSVTVIGDQTFVNCSSLTSVIIPDSVTTIGDYAFASCDSLTSVTIGSSVAEIGDEVFWNCSSLESLYYHGTAEEWLKISIGYNNYSLTSATRYYYSEAQPTEHGIFWKYGANSLER